MDSSSKTVVLITGANTGLGLETAKSLFARPESYHVLIGCRGDLERAKTAIFELRESSPASTSLADALSIDITSDESIASAFQQVQEKYGHIDVLVNNAGADLESAVAAGQMTPRECWNEMYNVNVTGTHLFTSAFAPLLLASKASTPRMLFITSGLSSLTELANGESPRYTNPPAGWPKPIVPFFPYRVSKSGMNMVATEWARLLRKDGVCVFLISPGLLNTGLGSNRKTGQGPNLGALGAIDPAIGAGFCADVIEGKRDGQAWPTNVLRKDAVQQW
ncbi:hypothetical protein JX265_012678 [Neoarthrinium moseri]|uniref:NAD(P)-binding protein n=1 Tax=Neoarthrinium moseri TaxID=1658444 RepID=A0A9Q0AID1_9PEZI|nr:uncharacterized protein JN550_011546 [Neoarthrinium moseri]KAI1842510.1 hypothetical protein JX266_011264 [Neoarthrinium moseri]KAI1853847.1 hypothetical protein JX265_012678 [Neoarthrinium moseri]KAI1860394.1 hypothetical protein JN550_011546 [Neoarthrinium moseri]